MPSIVSFVSKLQADYPTLTFTASKDFYWSPSEQAIFYDASSDDKPSLLHELAHALLSHAGYTKDVELLEMERDAWTYARTKLAAKYTTAINEDMAEEALDSYRDWLHSRSVCPTCEATGIQKKKLLYRCLACQTEWKVNEARICALRRYKIAN